MISASTKLHSKKFVEFNLKKGINGFYAGGSTGESIVMTNKERKEVFRIVKEGRNATKKIANTL